MSKHNRFVFFSSDPEIAGKLADSLEGLGTLVHEQPAPDALTRHLDDSLVNMVFLDFVPDDADNEKLARSIDMARLLNRHKPDMPSVAVGCMNSPGAAVAALRAGMNDFVDVDNPEEVRDTVKRLARRWNNGREDEAQIQAAPEHSRLLPADEEVADVLLDRLNHLRDNLLKIPVARRQHHADGFQPDFLIELAGDGFEHATQIATIRLEIRGIEDALGPLHGPQTMQHVVGVAIPAVNRGFGDSTTPRHFLDGHRPDAL